MVKTTKARNKIRQFFKNQDKEAPLPRVRSFWLPTSKSMAYIANKYLDKKHIEEILPVWVRSEEASMPLLALAKLVLLSCFHRLTEKEAMRKSVL